MNPLLRMIRRGSGPELYLERLHLISLNVDDDKFISGEERGMFNKWKREESLGKL